MTNSSDAGSAPEIHSFIRTTGSLLPTVGQRTEWYVAVRNLIRRYEDVHLTSIVYPRPVTDAALRGGRMYVGATELGSNQVIINFYDSSRADSFTDLGNSSTHVLPEARFGIDASISASLDQNPKTYPAGEEHTEAGQQVTWLSAHAEMVTGFNLLATAVERADILIPIEPQARLAALANLGIHASPQ